MWIDDHNVLHTVALPIPAEVMSVEFRRGLDGLIARERDRLRDLVEAAQSRILEMDWSHMSRAEYAETAPPRELLQGPVSTCDDVIEAIEGVSDRWRLDVTLAVEDYID